ncbi:MAG: hypothetical protein R6V58_03945 [Planctomycetota bacterium]
MNEPNASLWDETRLEPDDCLHWRIGPLGVWVRRTETEWRVAEQRGEGEEAIAADRNVEPPADVEWSRWAGETGDATLRLRPVLPDRAVVVRPAQPVTLLPRGTARIYIIVPVFIRLELNTEPKPTTLADIPTVRLSNTWFGSLFEGELCYWTETAARRSAARLPAPPHVVVTPMDVRNAAEEQLPLETVCMGTERLAVYQGEERLWTNELKVTNSGGGAPQRLDPGKGPPREAPDARQLSPARAEPTPGLAARAIGLVQALPGAAQVRLG